MNLDDLDRDRPDLGCEPQQARTIARNLQLDETEGAVTEMGGRGAAATDEVNVVKPSGYSDGNESGSREPEAARGLEDGDGERQVCVAGRCGPLTGDVGAGAP